MKAATISEIKKELNQRSPKELVEYCLTLAKFKKESKELLTYLIYEKQNEASYIQSVKREIDQQFEEVNRKNYYVIKKGIRKILRNLKKFIRYSKRKDTEVELLIYFCKKLKRFNPTIKRSTVLTNIYHRQIEMIKKKLPALEEDLQYDFGVELEEMITK